MLLCFPHHWNLPRKRWRKAARPWRWRKAARPCSYSIGRVVAGPKLGRYEPKTAVFKLTQVSPKLSRRQSWAQLCFTFHLAMCEGLCSAGFSTYPNSESFDDPYGRIEHICASCILNTSIWQDGYGKETFECSICYFVSLIIEIFHVSLLTAWRSVTLSRKRVDIGAALPVWSFWLLNKEVVRGRPEGRDAPLRWTPSGPVVMSSPWIHGSDNLLWRLLF